MRRIIMIPLLLASPSLAAAHRPSKRVEMIVATGDELSPATAFKVRNFHDEYAVVAALKLTVISQSLRFDKKAYDVLKVKNEDGVRRELWFEIDSFFPRL